MAETKPLQIKGRLVQCPFCTAPLIMRDGVLSQDSQEYVLTVTGWPNDVKMTPHQRDCEYADGRPLPSGLDLVAMLSKRGSRR